MAARSVCVVCVVSDDGWMCVFCILVHNVIIVRLESIAVFFY